MKCNNCGADNDGEFCLYCGTNFKQKNTTPEQTTVQSPFNPVQKLKKPIFKQWWVWLIVIFIGIYAVSQSGNSLKKVSNVTQSSISQPQANSMSNTEETFGINETAVLKTLKITANELKESNGKQFAQPHEGKVFLGVKFTIENISEKDQIMSSLLLFNAYIDGVKCNYSLPASIVFDEGTIDGTVAPNKKLVGWYTVEVPKDWSNLELQIKSSWLESTKATFIFRAN